MLLSEIRLSNICYHYNSEMYICNLMKSDEAELWYKRLRHIDIHPYAKPSERVVLEIPILKYDTPSFYNKCPIGKTIKASDKSTSQYITNRVLELLYLDLMRSMQVKSLGRTI